MFSMFCGDLSLFCSTHRSMQYISRDLSEQFLRLSSYPDSMYKKVTLLKYFRNYMSEHLLKVMTTLYKPTWWLYAFIACVFPFIKAGGALGEREIDEGVRLPFLRMWTRTKSAIVLHLSNGTLQVTTYYSLVPSNACSTPRHSQDLIHVRNGR